MGHSGWKRNARKNNCRAFSDDRRVSISHFAAIIHRAITERYWLLLHTAAAKLTGNKTLFQVEVSILCSAYSAFASSVNVDTINSLHMGHKSLDQPPLFHKAQKAVVRLNMQPL